MAFYHVTARTHPGFRPFADRDTCARFWARMREIFPKTSGLVLMPNHIHLVIETEDIAQLVHRLGVELRALAQRRYPGKLVWERGKIPEAITNQKHLRRNLRYIYLNPARDGLVNDILTWEWSTYRDLAGATADRWAPDPREGFELFHDYASADPSTQVQGTPLPQPLNIEIYFPPAVLVEAVRVAMGANGRPVYAPEWLPSRLRSAALRSAS